MPDKGRVYYYDDRTASLCLCITHTALRTFYSYKKVDGRPQRIRLGRFPETTIDHARTAVAEMLGEVAKGRDPAAERRARRTVPTLAELWIHWEQYAADHKKPSSQAEDKRQYDKFLAKWSARRLSDISNADVAKLHRTIGEASGRYQANRVLALIKAMFNQARTPAFGWKGENPATGVRKFKEQSRERWLDGDELRAFFTALEAEPNEVFRDFFMLAILTGARRSNLQEMAWVDVRLDIGVWRIPETKGGIPVLVPLPPPAISVLERRSKTCGKSLWVFPSHGKHGHITEPKTAWRRICDAAGLQDIRLHDLRRCVGSWMANSGSSLQVIGALLGHKNESTTKIYSKLTLDPVREGLATATEKMLAAGGVKVLEGKGAADD